MVAAVRDAFLALVVSAQQVAVGQGVKSVDVVEVQAQLCFQLNVVGQNVGHAQGGGQSVVVVFPLHGAPGAFRNIFPRLLGTHEVPNGIVSALCRLRYADVAVDVSHGEIQRKRSLFHIVGGAQRVAHVFVSRHDTAVVVFVEREKELVAGGEVLCETGVCADVMPSNEKVVDVGVVNKLGVFPGLVAPSHRYFCCSCKLSAFKCGAALALGGDNDNPVGGFCAIRCSSGRSFNNVYRGDVVHR